MKSMTLVILGMGLLLGACTSASFGTRAERAARDADGRKADGGGAGADAGADGEDGRDGNGEGGDDADQGAVEGSGGVSGDAGIDGDGASSQVDGGLEGDDDAAGGGLATDEDTLASKCDVPTGDAVTKAVLGGEDVPGNGLLGGPDKGKPLGSDFDDYTLTFKGALVLDSASSTDVRLGVKKATTIDVGYARGTTDCAHSFEFIYRRCPNRQSAKIGSQTLAIGTAATGQVTLKVPRRDVFIDIVMHVTRGDGRTFGGCDLPIAVENRLYENGAAAFLSKD